MEEGEGRGSGWGRAYVVPAVSLICQILEQGMCMSVNDMHKYTENEHAHMHINTHINTHHLHGAVLHLFAFDPQDDKE